MKMKVLMYSLLALIVMMGTDIQAKEKANVTSARLKVFILAGQSNMQGFGFISEGKDGDLDHTAKKEGFEYLSDDSGEWVEREDVWYYHKTGKGAVTKCTLSVENVQKIYRGHKSIGPELTFGHILGQHYDSQVLLIKCAWGGQPIAGSFRPPSSGPMADGTSPDYMGTKYRAVLSETKDVLDNLKTYFPGYDGKGYEIAGFY